MDTPCDNLKSLNKIIKNGFVMEKSKTKKINMHYCISKNLKPAS